MLLTIFQSLVNVNFCVLISVPTCSMVKVQIVLRVFRVEVSAVIQLPFRGTIQIVNLGARNVGNVKRP